MNILDTISQKISSYAKDVAKLKAIDIEDFKTLLNDLIENYRNFNASLAEIKNDEFNKKFEC